jgi:hypothetical protein
MSCAPIGQPQQTHSGVVMPSPAGRPSWAGILRIRGMPPRALQRAVQREPWRSVHRCASSIQREVVEGSRAGSGYRPVAERTTASTTPAPCHDQVSRGVRWLGDRVELVVQVAHGRCVDLQELAGTADVLDTHLDALPAGETEGLLQR